MNINAEIEKLKNNLVSASTSINKILRSTGRLLTKDTHSEIDKIGRIINSTINKLEEIEKSIK